MLPPVSDVAAHIRLPSAANRNPSISDTTVPYRRLNAPSMPFPRNRLYTIYSMRFSLIRKSRARSRRKRARCGLRLSRWCSHSRNRRSCSQAENGATNERRHSFRCACTLPCCFQRNNRRTALAYSPRSSLLSKCSRKPQTPRGGKVILCRRDRTRGCAIISRIVRVLGNGL